MGKKRTVDDGFNTINQFLNSNDGEVITKELKQVQEGEDTIIDLIKACVNTQDIRQRPTPERIVDRLIQLQHMIVTSKLGQADTSLASQKWPGAL